jgi:hypothetical protein
MKAKKFSLTLYLLLIFSTKTFSQLPDWVPSGVIVDCQQYTHTVPCRGGTGYIHVEILEGDPPFSFTWYDANGNIISNEQNLDSVPASKYGPGPDDYGVYLLEIRKDTSSFVYQVDVSLMEPDSFFMTLNSYDTLGYNIYQHGGSNGHISSQVYGGTPPYVYNWSNGSQEADIAGLVAGNYTLTVTDANGCSIQKTESLREPAAALEITSMNGTLHHGYHISCFDGNDGSIDVTVTGGVAPYSFDWYGNINSFNEDVTNLKSGTYTVIVTDMLGIKDTASITLTQPPALFINLTPLVYPNDYNVSCFNCYNGKLTAAPSGGVLPYTYHWASGETTLIIDTLGHGEYEFFVTDANGCNKSKNIILTTPERDDWSMNGNAGIDPGSQFIGTTDSSDLVIKTNNTERIIIKSDGTINLKGNVKLDSIGPDSINAVYTDSHGLLRVGPSDNPTQLCKTPAYAFYRKLCPLDYNYYFVASNNTIPPSKLVIGNPASLPGSYKLYVTGGILTERLRIADASSSYWADFVFEKDYNLMSLSDLNSFIHKNKHLPGIPTSEEVSKEGIDIADMQSKLLLKIEELTLYIIEQNKRITLLEKNKEK